MFSKDSYKFFSGLSPSGNVTSIGTNLMTYITLHCQNLVDNKTLKMSDVLLEFISTKANTQFKTKMNPERQLIRFQYMEIWVRIAITKYYRSKHALLS